MSINLTKLRKIYFSLSILTVGLIATSTQAIAEPLSLDQEVQFAGNFFHTQGADTGSANVDSSYGYFLSKEVELGLRAAYSGAYNDKGRDEWLVTTAPFLDYHILGLSDQNRIVPFVGGQIGGTWNDRDGSGIVGPEAGVKWYFTPNTSLIARYRYDWTFSDVNVGEGRSRGNHAVTLGFGYGWGGVGNREKY